MNWRRRKAGTVRLSFPGLGPMVIKRNKGGAAMANDWKELIGKLRVKPGDKVKLKASDTRGKDLFSNEEETRAAIAALAADINDLQDRLYAERRRSLLVVLQGIDSSGKDGTIRDVFNATGPSVFPSPRSAGQPSWTLRTIISGVSTPPARAAARSASSTGPITRTC